MAEADCTCEEERDAIEWSEVVPMGPGAGVTHLRLHLAGCALSGLSRDGRDQDDGRAGEKLAIEDDVEGVAPGRLGSLDIDVGE